jgi:predicted RNase H-like HicB family nuclease
MSAERNYSFRVMIEPDDPEGFHGFVPLLPGIHTSGDTLEETKQNLREAIRVHLEGLLKDGEEVPQEGDTLELIQTFSSSDFKN